MVFCPQDNDSAASSPSASPPREASSEDMRASHDEASVDRELFGDDDAPEEEDDEGEDLFPDDFMER